MLEWDPGKVPANISLEAILRTNPDTVKVKYPDGTTEWTRIRKWDPGALQVTSTRYGKITVLLSALCGVGPGKKGR